MTPKQLNTRNFDDFFWELYFEDDLLKKSSNSIVFLLSLLHLGRSSNRRERRLRNNPVAVTRIWKENAAWTRGANGAASCW